MMMNARDSVNMGTLKKKIYVWVEARMYIFGLVFSGMISMIPKKIFDIYIYIYTYIYTAVDPGFIMELPILKQRSLNDSKYMVIFWDFP